MNSLVGFDWIGYFHSLSDDEMRHLANWLVAERLHLGEFMEVVDRVYARASDEWRGQPSVFVVWHGRAGAEDYARRKRRFAELIAALDEARMTGALPGDVAPDELGLSPPCRAEAPSIREVLGALQFARHSSG